MPEVRITKIFFFESAHALAGYDGKCRNIHGHSYQLWVTVSGKIRNESGHPKDGMLMDFGDLKRIVKQQVVDVFDHALVINAHSQQKHLGETIGKSGYKVILTGYQPTSEMMLVDFARRIGRELPEGVKLHSLRLYETATSFAEWHASDNG